MDDTNDVAQNGLDALADSVLGPADEITNEAPVQAQETTPEVPQEPQAQEQIEQVSEPTQGPSTSPEQVVTAPAEEEEQEQPFQPTYNAVPPLDLSQLPQDEDGNVDANALAQAIANRDQLLLQQSAQMVAQAEERRQEEKLWTKAIEAHPELSSDKALVEEVNALRFGLFASEINSGKQGRMLTPVQAYKRLSTRFAQAEAKGVQQATESVKIQDSVYTQPTANAGSAKSDEADLFRQMRSGNKQEAEAAQDAILSKRLFGE
jgi:hypothetical protein